MCRLLAVNSPLLRYISNLNLRLSCGQRVRAGSPIRLSRNDLQTSETGKEEGTDIIKSAIDQWDEHKFWLSWFLHAHDALCRQELRDAKLLQPCPSENSQRTKISKERPHWQIWQTNLFETTAAMSIRNFPKNNPTGTSWYSIRIFCKRTMRIWDNGQDDVFLCPSSTTARLALLF